jgi:hypothetical protein
MKLKLILILIALTPLCHAQLADLTPGGFDMSNPPKIYQKLFDPRLRYMDQAIQGVFQFPDGEHYFNGWGSYYEPIGDLEGGIYFFTNLFVLKQASSVQVWWSFPPDLQPPFSLAMLFVSGRTLDNRNWGHLYQVPRGHRLQGLGTVTVDGRTPVRAIVYYWYAQ